MFVLVFVFVFVYAFAKCTRSQCLAVSERESPSDLALLDFISAPPGPTKDIDLVERKLSRAASSSQMKG